MTGWLKDQVSRGLKDPLNLIALAITVALFTAVGVPLWLLTSHEYVPAKPQPVTSPRVPDCTWALPPGYGEAIEMPGDWCIEVPAGKALKVRMLGESEVIAMGKTVTVILRKENGDEVDRYSLTTGENHCRPRTSGPSRHTHYTIEVEGGGPVRVRSVGQGRARLTYC